MEIYTAENAREDCKVIKENSRLARLNKAVQTDFYQEIITAIKEAVAQGSNHIGIYPHPYSFYEEIIQNYHRPKSSDKIFTKEQENVIKVLEESLGYKTSIVSACSCIFENPSKIEMPIELFISKALIYW